MKRMIQWVLCGVALCMIGYSALAQEPVDKPWRVSVKAGAIMDDNRDGLDTNKESNLDIRLTPRVEGRLDNGRTLFDIYYEPTLLWHSNPREEGEPSPQNDTEIYHGVGADFRHEITPATKVTVNEYFADTEDPSINDNNGSEIRRSESHIANMARASVDMGLSERLKWNVGADNSLKRYGDDVISESQDEDIVAGESSLGYDFAEGFTVLGHVRYSDFENKSLEVDRGAQIMTYDLGVAKVLNPNVAVRAAAGYQNAEYDSDAIESDGSFYSKADVTFSATATRLRLGGGYGLTNPDVSPYSVQERLYVSATMERDVTERIMLALLARYGTGSYDEFTGENGETYASGDDDLAEYGIAGTYKLSRNLSAEVSYLYQDWSSDLRESFQRNMVSAMLKAEL